MSARRTFSRLCKAKSGMASVLGMLIFIGVMFTCVIPLFLYVNEVNSIYDRTVVEMKHLDEDREREQIDVYAYSPSETGGNLSVYVKSKCPSSIQIVRVWINDQPFSSSLLIPGMEHNTTEPIDVSEMLPESGVKSFNVKVTTAKGNSFSSLTNPLYYTAEVGGGWSGGTSFAINIVMELDFGVYDFHIKVEDSQARTIYEEDIFVILEASIIRKANVDGPDTYHVEITQTLGPDKTWSTDVPITLEEPSQWVYPPKDYW